ncbi:hypothetical protein PPO43_05125 [Saprospira sp. CCB-QB6]|uniref:hypothetical protein n=1 Tax=Saprospira sp. CCB-QB6 TaxID=3023936 RepID=UPI00234B1982|nr:hypothetical protein [Saprospira sp. CCB-QB6]WCL82480.1 hypothetical protein PPO43_05125 [Saprospira sp. CCB-QB6]
MSKGNQNTSQENQKQRIYEQLYQSLEEFEANEELQSVQSAFEQVDSQANAVVQTPAEGFHQESTQEEFSQPLNESASPLNEQLSAASLNSGIEKLAEGISLQEGEEEQSSSKTAAANDDDLPPLGAAFNEAELNAEIAATLGEPIPTYDETELDAAIEETLEQDEISAAAAELQAALEETLAEGAVEETKSEENISAEEEAKSEELANQASQKNTEVSPEEAKIGGETKGDAKTGETTATGNPQNKQQNSAAGGEAAATEATGDQKGQEAGAAFAARMNMGPVAKTAEESAEEQELEAGRAFGLDVGRSGGLGKKVTTDESGKMNVAPFAEGETADAYVEAQRAVIASKSQKYQTGFYQGFNQGYPEGQKLKVEAAQIEEQQKMATDPEAQEGTKDGTESAVKSNSSKAEDKERAKVLKAAVDNRSKTYQVAYYRAFNAVYMQARAAAVKKSMPGPAELMENPTYRKGYELGYNIGLAEGQGKAPEGMTKEQGKQAANYADDNKDASGQPIADDPKKLYSRAFYHGFNASYMKGKETKVKAEKEERKKDPHYAVGHVMGTLAAMSSEEKAKQVLKGTLPLSELGENLPPVPDSAKQYFAEGKDKEQTAEQKKSFEVGYFHAFNASYNKFKQQKLDNEQKAKTNSVEYKKGQDIGKIAAAATVNLDRYKKDLKQTEDPKEKEALTAKIEKIEENLATIDEQLNDENVKKEFSTGYYHAFNTNYNVEKQKLVDKEMSVSADSPKAKGYEAGRHMGGLFYDHYRAAQGDASKKAEVDAKVEEAFTNAKAEGEEFEKGYYIGYNQTVYSGADGGKQAQTKEERAEAQELRNAKEEFGQTAGGVDYVEKGREYGYGLWFKYESTAQKERPSQTPDEAWRKKKEGLAKVIQEEMQGKADTQKLEMAFAKGYRVGKSAGEREGKQYFEGYDDAMTGKQKQATPTSHYQQGYSAGRQASQYDNFRGQALSQMIEGYENDSAQAASIGQSDEFREGYDLDYDNWLFIAKLANGQDASDLSGSLKLYGDEEAPEAQIGAAAKTQANEILAQKEAKMQAALSKKRKELEEKAQKAAANPKKESAPEDPLAKVDSQMAEIEKGYQQALEDATAKVAKQDSAEKARQDGLLFGYQSVEGYPPLAGQEEALAAAAGKDTEYAQADKNTLAAFNAGKAEGYKMAQMLQAGLISTEEVNRKIQGGGHDRGYQLGQEIARKDIAAHKKALLNGENFESQKEAEAEKLDGPTQEGFLNGYQYLFDKGEAYNLGYQQGYLAATNEKEGDNFEELSYTPKDPTLSYASELEGQFHLGRTTGRQDGLNQTINGETKKSSSVLDQRIEELRTTLGDAYANAYEKGYSYGRDQRQASPSQMANLQGEFEANGVPTMLEDLKAFLPKIIQIAKETGQAAAEELEDSQIPNILSQIEGQAQNLLGFDQNATPLENHQELTTTLISQAEGLLTEQLSNEDKQFMRKTIAEWEKQLQSFKEGYIRGARKGLVEGINNSETAEEGAALAEATNYQTQLLAAAGNVGQDKYVQGYEKARELLIEDSYNSPNSSSAEMEKGRYRLVGEMRKALNELIKKEKSEAAQQTSSSDEDEALAVAVTNAYADLIRIFGQEHPTALAPGQNQNDYIDDQVLALQAEYDNFIADFDKDGKRSLDKSIRKQLKANFQALYQSQIQPFFQQYKEGFQAGYTAAIQEVLQGNTGVDGVGSGNAEYSAVEKLHEQLEAGLIKDGDVNSLSLLNQYDPVLDLLFEYTDVVAQDQELFYAAEDATLDLQDQIKEKTIAKEGLEARQNQLSAEEQAELDDIRAELDELQEELEMAQEEHFEAFEELNVVYEGIEDQLGFTKGGSSEPKALLDYLSMTNDEFTLQGSYTYQDNQLQIQGNGSFFTSDSQANWIHQAAVEFQIADLKFNTNSFEYLESSRQVNLQAGQFSVPIEEGGNSRDISIDFSGLNLKAGESLIDQIEVQLDLGAGLNGGGLMENDLG